MQGKQIARLEEKIKSQNIEIEQKNKMIDNLISKQQRSQVNDSKMDIVQTKKMQDLQIRLRMVVEQL